MKREWILLIGIAAMAAPGEALGADATLGSIGDLGVQMRKTAERIRGGQALLGQSALHEACGEHLTYETTMQTVLAAVARLEPAEALSRLKDLQAGGGASGHLGWAALLSVRSQGYAPREAVYCHDQGTGSKWIGVAAADGLEFILDLSEVARTGAGLRFSARKEGAELGSASGRGLETLLDAGEGRGPAGGVVGSVLRGLKGGDFRSWYDGAGAGAARAPSGAGLRPLFAGDETSKYRRLIEETAYREGLHPSLVHAIMRREDPWGDNGVRSSAHAIGLMQLMPGTARSLGLDPEDPVQNIQGGARYLRHLLRRFDQNLPLAVAAYNAGETAVGACGGIPEYRETAFFVAAVFNNYYWLTGRKVDYEKYMTPRARAWIRKTKAY